MVELDSGYHLGEIKDQRPKLDFELTVTLPTELEESAAIVKRAEELGVTEHLNNLGCIPVGETPALYEQSHIAFLPSLLEVFSAVYPESMSTGLPLVTTNLRFATDACKDAAAYFVPTNADDAAKKIIRLAEDREYWERKSARGLEIYSELPNAQQKWDLQKDVIMKVASLQQAAIRPQVDFITESRARSWVPEDEYEDIHIDSYKNVSWRIIGKRK